MRRQVCFVFAGLARSMKAHFTGIATVLIPLLYQYSYMPLLSHNYNSAHAALPPIASQPDTIHIFGGQLGVSDADAYVDDVWSYSTTTKKWTLLHNNEVSGPSARGVSLVTQSADDSSRGILFGGFGGFFEGLDDRLYNDLWSYTIADSSSSKDSAMTAASRLL
jgi:hypothetical protein